LLELGVHVAGVVGQEAGAVARYLTGSPLPFPLLIDPERKVIRGYGVYQFLGIDAFNIARPSQFLVDRDGRIRFLYVGSSQWDRPAKEGLLGAAAKL
jgi:peroxiredoxin